VVFAVRGLIRGIYLGMVKKHSVMGKRGVRRGIQTEEKHGINGFFQTEPFVHHL